MAVTIATDWQNDITYIIFYLVKKSKIALIQCLGSQIFKLLFSTIIYYT